MSYFTIKELTFTNHKIDNEPSEIEIENLQLLIDNVLNPARLAFNKAIIVNSGYRCKELNDIVKGSKNSQHMTGQAADITTDSKDNNKKLFKTLKRLNNFDQLINEYDYSWIHVSYSNTLNRKQILNIK